VSRTQTSTTEPDRLIYNNQSDWWL